MTTHYIYTLSYCPMKENGDTGKQRDCLWQAAQRFALQDNHYDIELCYVAKSHRTIQPFIVVHLPDEICLAEPNRQEFVESFERLLPDNYGWKRITVAQYRETLSCIVTSDACFSTLRRRFEFFDIDPRKWILGTPQEMWGKSKQTDAVHSVDFREQYNFCDSEWDCKKELPEDAGGLMSQFQIGLVSVPYLHPLTTTTDGLHGLFSEMLYASPAMVSISLSRGGTLTDTIDKISQTASFALSCLAPLHSLTDTYDSKELNATEDFYKSYRHAKQLLVKYRIKIFTSNPSRTKSLAICFAAQFGGSRVFDISAPLSINEEKMQSTVEKLPIEFAENDIETDIMQSDNRWLPLIANAPHIIAPNEKAILFQLPVGTEQGLPGMKVRQVPPFASHLPQIKNDNEILPMLNLGQMKTSKIEDDKSVKDFHRIPMGDLCRHVFVCGSTGSGKTTAVQYMLRQLPEAKVPFLVVEPAMKVEYYDKLKNDIPSLVRITLDSNIPEDDHTVSDDGSTGNSTRLLTFDPFHIIPGIEFPLHVSYLKSCFQAAFPLSEFHASCLEAMLTLFYEDAGRNNLTPSFNLFLKHMPSIMQHMFPKWFPKESNDKEQNANSRVKDEYNILDMFMRRFKNLALSPLGRCFERAERFRKKNKREFDIRTYFKEGGKSYILELNTIQDRELKSLTMAFFLTFIMEARQAEGVCEGRDKPKHILVLEEAHRLLTRGNTSRSAEYSSGDSASVKAAGMFGEMLAEIRSFGQGIVIAEQIPSKIISDAVKNTNLKILMRLNTGDDREFMGQAMNCSESQKRFVSTLEPGQAVVFAQGLEQPILLKIPHNDDSDDIVR